MTKGTLSECLKEGYPFLKESSGLPVWFIPQHSFSTVLDGMGENNLVEISHLLGMSIGKPELTVNSESSPEIWTAACLNWPHLSTVYSTITLLMESVDVVMARYRQCQFTTQLEVVFRGLTVISFAPFVPQGREILTDFATILNGVVDDPFDLTKRYIDAVLSDNIAITRKVIECTGRYSGWTKWLDRIEEMAHKFDIDYKLIAVTPPVSERLTSVLAEMFKETNL